MLSKQEEQLERRETLDNDRLVREQGGSTFLAHTHNDVGGRFAAISSPTVVGEKQIPQYPAAFHQHDPVPDEPALGIDINAMEPVGQPHELAASIASLGPSLPSAKATPNRASDDAPLQAPLASVEQRGARLGPSGKLTPRRGREGAECSTSLHSTAFHATTISVR